MRKQVIESSRLFQAEKGLPSSIRNLWTWSICDLGMPGMNGWDVGKAIRSICRDKGISKPPFVLLTGWGGQELEREKIAESGTDAVVAKPIDSAALLATVQEIAERFNIRSRVYIRRCSVSTQLRAARDCHCERSEAICCTGKA